MTNYHPSDTREVVKSEFVFEQSPQDDNRGRDSVLSALKEGGKPSEPLPKVFEDNNFELSNDARVWKLRNGWMITDKDQSFLIKKEQNVFKVYERPTIDNCALEYSYFLEIDPPNNIDKIDFPRYIQDPNPCLVTHLRDRQKQQLVQFAKQGIELYCVDATVDWRLVVGLGGEHVQETSMTLHHIYGVPYIPGSAVKGVLRHWWLQILKEDDNFRQKHPNFIKSNDEIDESIAWKDPDFLAIFGSPEQRGEVRFLDAYPTEAVNFAIDIMNPHFGEYYGGDKPPTDHQKLNIINFLTVEETKFRFAFLSQDQKWLCKLKARFEDALDIKGIGAKTSVGYGYFRDFEESTKVIESDDG